MSIKYGKGNLIQIAGGHINDKIFFSVQDHGIGIPKNRLDKIFERFERVTSESYVSGLGLGLYISRQIIEVHHGSISVSSRPEKGSIFTVELLSFEG